MTKEEAERFFKLYGNASFSNMAASHFTVEQLYQAIYRRLFDERAVLKHVHHIDSANGAEEQ